MILRRNFQIQINLRLLSGSLHIFYLKALRWLSMSQIGSRGEKISPGQVISDGQMDALIIIGRPQSGLLIRQLA